MKSRASKLLAALALPALLSTLNSQLSTAFAQGTAFTYQGRLDDSGAPANGTYDIRAGLFTTNSGGSTFAGPITNDAVAVSNGLFTIPLDFSNVFDGTIYWLQLSVRTNGASSFTILSPRQRLTPAPYSIFAEGGNAAGLTGAIPSASLAGTYGSSVSFTNPGSSFAGNGAGLNGVDAAMLGGLAASNFWQLGGNIGVGGQFLGTLNNQPLDFYANGLRAMRLVLRTDASGTYSNAPDVIAGSAVNLVKVGVVGATVSGGGGNDTNGVSYLNQVNADFGTVSGGLSNNVSSLGVYAFIGGGEGNTAGQGYGTIAGGLQNTVNNAFTTIGGGAFNTASGPQTVVGGGYANTASGVQATVGGGEGNVAGGSESMIGGGMSNNVSGTGSFIGGGGFDGTYYQGNSLQGNAAVIVGGLSNNIPSGGSYSFIGGGYFNTASNNTAVIGGGGYNTAGGYYSTIAGGYINVASGTGSFIGGGGFDGVMAGQNVASGGGSVIGGGLLNTNAGMDAAIGGGIDNYVGGSGSFIGGGGYDGTKVVGNYVNANAATIAGGLANLIPSGSRYAFIGGGVSNTTSAYYATVAGGLNNVASGQGAFVGGGGTDGVNSPGPLYSSGNLASAGGAAVLGGYQNFAIGLDSTDTGGAFNEASGDYSVVGGGWNSFATGNYSTVPGGLGNMASGANSFAAGKTANATHANSFVWSDGTAGTTSFANDQFMARASGGVVFLSGTGASPTSYSSGSAGVALQPGATSWSTISDRNAKKNFQPVDTVAVLDKLAAIPVRQWNYKWETDTATPNIGPMAQDFKAAFYPGRDDKSISTLEFDGVELAAIQGLNEKLEDRSRKSEAGIQKAESQIEELKTENADLKARLEKLEQFINSQKGDLK